MIDSFDQSRNISKWIHKFVALITDSRHTLCGHYISHECTIDSGASTSMTPSREMFRDYKPCTNDGFLSVAQKGGCRIKGYGKIILKFRENKFILLKRVAYVPISLFGLIPRIMVCDTSLMFKERSGTHVDVIEHWEYDTTQTISCSDGYPIHQVCATLIHQSEITCMTADIDLMHPCFRDSDGYG